jgi:hypothetical protein
LSFRGWRVRPWRGARQQGGQALFPEVSLGADGQQLVGGQADGLGLGADQPGAGVKWSAASAWAMRSARRSGQPCRPVRAKATSWWREALASWSRVGQHSSSRSMVGAPRLSPAIASAAGKVDSRSRRSRLPRRRLGSGDAFVVAGDRAQLGGQLPMEDEWPQAGVAVQGEQAGDAGVFGVVFLARRAAAAGDQVGTGRTT